MRRRRLASQEVVPLYPVVQSDESVSEHGTDGEKAVSRGHRLPLA